MDWLPSQLLEFEHEQFLLFCYQLVPRSGINFPHLHQRFYFTQASQILSKEFKISLHIFRLIMFEYYFEKGLRITIYRFYNDNILRVGRTKVELHMNFRISPKFFSQNKMKNEKLH